MLTTAIDPDVIRVVFAPLQIAKILGGERKAGDWLEETRIFPVVEETGEVSSYDDFSNNGRAGHQLQLPAVPVLPLPDLHRLRRAGDGTRRPDADQLRRRTDGAASGLLNRFGNLAYAFGIAGLQNYGIINNPYLSAYLPPAMKACGRHDLVQRWFAGRDRERGLQRHPRDGGADHQPDERRRRHGRTR